MQFRTTLISLLLVAVFGACETNPPVERPDSIPRPNGGMEQSTSATTPTPEMTEKPTNTPVAQEIEPTPTPTLSPEQRRLAMNEFVKAALLQQAGRYDEASHAYLDTIQQIPESSYTYASAAESMLQSGMADDAIELAKEAVRINPDEADAHEVMARAYLSLRDRKQAIVQFEIMLRLKPHSLETMAELANLYLLEEQYENAVDLYRRIARLVPYQSYIYRLQVAFLLFKLERYSEALDEYKVLAKEIPDSYDVYLQMGTIYQILGQVDNAIESYLTALHYIYNPKTEQMVRQSLAELYQSRGSETEAMHQYNRIIEIHPNDTRAHMALAELYRGNRDYEKALQEIDILLANGNEGYEIRQLQFDLFKRMQRVRDAYETYLGAFEQAIESKDLDTIYPYWWDLLRDDALKQIQAMKLENRLLSSLNQAAEALPDEPRAQFALVKYDAYFGRTAFLKDRLQKILTSFRMALSEEDTTQMDQIAFEYLSWLTIRKAYSEHGMERELVMAMEAVRTKYPSRNLSYQVLGRIYMDKQDWFQAGQIFSGALEAVSEDSDGYEDLMFLLAFTQEKLNRIDEVERIMNQAMERYPDDAEVYNYLGYTYADRNMHLEKALSLIEKAMKLDPKNGNIIDSLGWAYYRLGRIGEAVATLEKALALEEDHPVILEHLGDAYDKKGDLRAALDRWQKSYETGPNFPYEFTDAMQQRLLQKIQNAKRLLQGM